MTHTQRFDITMGSHTVFAPLSHGCASMLFATDYSAFKKSAEEKAKLYGIKKELGKTKHHKFERQFRGSF